MSARSLRVCAWINIKQAKAARRSGFHHLASHHLNVAKECRRDARLLKSKA